MPVRLNTDDALTLRGIYAEQEYSTNLINSNIFRVIDLGAHCGFGAAYLSARFPNATLVCLEPDPRNVIQLTKTIEMNDIKAKIISAGIGPKTGLFSISLSERPSCNQIALENTTNLQVPVLNLSDLLISLNWESVDLLKMDIEGMEAELFAESGEALKKVKYILFELHNCIDKERALKNLSELGFSLEHVHKSGEQVYLATNQGFHDVRH